MTKYVFITAVMLVIIGCGGNKGPKYSEEELAQIPQPQRSNLPMPSGGFVLALGEDTITAEEVIAPVWEDLAPLAQGKTYEEFAPKAIPLVSRSLMNRVSDIILYQKAKKQAGENIEEQLDKIVESEIRKFIMGFEGDYAKAEAFLKERYGMDWREFRRHQRRLILSSSFLQELMPKEAPIIYSDLMDYYNSHKDLLNEEATITMQLIDIDIMKIEPADANSNQQQTAHALAEQLAAKARSGEDFGELAKEYSHGYRASFGGLWKPIKPESVAAPYDVLAVQANAMQIGDIAGPVESAEHLFVMKLCERKAASIVPFEQVQKQIEQQIIMERKSIAFTEAMNKVIAEAAITGVDKFVMFCVEQIYIKAN